MATPSRGWILIQTATASETDTERRLQHHFSLATVCGSVAEWLGRWTCDQQVAGSNPGFPAVDCNPGQVGNAHVPLSPSSIIWYQPMGGDISLTAGKVTVGLESHWPRITDISGSPTTGSRPRRGRWAPAYALLVEYGELYPFFTLG